MIKHAKIVQGSAQWLALRAGIVTASVMSELVTPKKRKIAKANSLLYRLLAERFLGRPLDQVNIGWAGDQGKILEDEAIPRFELDTGLITERVGFITTDDGKIGCSPDALVEGGGVEAKCCLPQTHVEFLLGNKVPDEHFGQVQGGLLVTGLPVWWFVSYCRGFPPLIVKVDRDEAYLAVLSEAIRLFNQRLDAAYSTLVAFNGGPPNRIVVPEKDLIGEFYGEVPQSAEDEAAFLEFLNGS